MANTVTSITILSNGTYSPNKTITLGNKYENVGDTIVFTIPNEYKTCHHYLTFKMPKKDTILLPVNSINGTLTFFITATVTKNAGTYEVVFLSTEDPITDNDIEESKVVFVSNVMTASVSNNFLTNPVDTEAMDDNLQHKYEDMDELYDEFLDKLEGDGFVGPYYIPHMNANTGVLSWTRSDNKTTPMPADKNLTGPTGPYYKPSVTNGVLSWTGSSTTVPAVASTDLNVLIKNASDTYLNTYLGTQLDAKIPPEVTKQINEKFRWTWDATNKVLKIWDVPSDT